MNPCISIINHQNASYLLIPSQNGYEGKNLIVLVQNALAYLDLLHPSIEIFDISRFKGELKDGHPWTGEGRLESSRNGFFEGTLIKGSPWSGVGEIKHCSNGGFKGRWKDGKQWDGVGTITTVSGGIFNGQFKHGRPWNGEAEFFLIGSKMFNGQFSEGKLYSGEEQKSYRDGAKTTMVQSGVVMETTISLFDFNS